MMLRKYWPGVLGIVLALAVGALAQETQTQVPSQGDAIRRERTERMERHRERMQQREGMRARRGMRRHLMHELNLSEEQRTAGRGIIQRRLQGLKGQREELFQLREKRIAGTFTDADQARAKALHEEIRTAMRGARSEMESLLNAEQKARLEQLKLERKSRMEERLKERQQRLEKRQERLNMKPS